MFRLQIWGFFTEIPPFIVKNHTSSRVKVTYCGRILPARTRTFVERLGVGWRGSMLTANLSCLYHDLYQRKDLDDKDKENRYWEFAGEVQLRLPRQWTMSVNGNYHTTIRTLYQIVDPYFRLDARVEKAFGKAWMVFLDGRDLLDRPIGNGIISDIEKQNWYEETRSNRRLVQAGVTFQF